jgi:glucose/arabinose dehydrogenase
MTKARPRRATTLVAALLPISLVALACGAGSATGEGDDDSGTAHTEFVTSSTSDGAEAPADRTSLEGVRLQLTPIAEIETPVAMAQRPSTNELYVADQSGLVLRITIDRSQAEPRYELEDRPVLDITDHTRKQGEQGLLGLAFSPDGSRLYLDYTDRDGDTHVDEYRMSGTGVDDDSRREILFVDQPFANHNGGQLAFGPDGFLYVAMGDGGGGGDPQKRAQNTDDLLGKILRIDPTTPSRGLAYGIPAGNPFATGGGAAEVWIYGVRNPWRFSFDQATSDLWVADVGQNRVEEVDWLPASTEGAGRGANLGWNVREGSEPFGDGQGAGDFVDPIFDYENGGDNCSVTGGYVYRGDAIPELQGAYLFGDYCAADIRGLLVREGQVLDERPLGVSVAANSLASFGQDADGEVYVLSTDGTVYKIEPA